MGRYTTTDVKSFSIFFLKRLGKLEPETTHFNSFVVWSIQGEEIGRIGYSISTVTGDSWIELDYKTRPFGEEWKKVKYKVPLESIKCNFGGKRWFFRCPLYCDGYYCGKRVAVLYQVGDYFGCRSCADLTYDSCNEGKRFRSYPWKIFSDDEKAEKLWDQIKRTHYAGKPTRKYRRYMKLVDLDKDVYEAQLASFKELL